MTMSPSTPTPYVQGENAMYWGLDRSINPYPSSTSEHQLWNEGYDNASLDPFLDRR
jgi:hypothetical protein